MSWLLRITWLLNAREHIILIIIRNLIINPNVYVNSLLRQIGSTLCLDLHKKGSKRKEENTEIYSFVKAIVSDQIKAKQSACYCSRGGYCKERRISYQSLDRYRNGRARSGVKGRDRQEESRMFEESFFLSQPAGLTANIIDAARTQSRAINIDRK